MPRSCRARAHDAAQAPATAAPDLLSLLAAEDEKKLPPDDGLMAGLDEAGRGCLAGPVVAAAVILPPLFDLPGLTDSKACTARTRERLAPRIRQCATAWGLGVVWPARIDRINILQATFEAMCGLCALPPPSGSALHRQQPHAAVGPAGCPLGQGPRRARAPAAPANLVRNVPLLPAISAASILAKTYRDALMAHLDRRWPGYGFAAHKGYGTKEHLAALRRLGPCPQHRLTFAGVLPAAPGPAQGSLL